MRILRLLLRAFRPSPRPKAVVVRRETSVAEDFTAWDTRSRVTRQTTQIRIVEVKELRGPAWVIGKRYDVTLSGQA